MSECQGGVHQPKAKASIRQRLSAHVQHRMANVANEATVSTEECGSPSESMMAADCIKVERMDDNNGQEEEEEEEEEAAAGAGDDPLTPGSPAGGVQQLQAAAGQSSSSSGSFMAGSLVFSNSILDEVLNEKKLALLQSPDVIRFLQEIQNKTKPDG